MSNTIINLQPPPPFNSDCVAMIQNQCNMKEILIFQSENINNIYTYNIMTQKYTQIDNTKTNFDQSTYKTTCLKYVKVLKTDKPHLIILFGSFDNENNTFYNVFDCQKLEWRNDDTNAIIREHIANMCRDYFHGIGCQVLTHKGYMFISGGIEENFRRFTIIKLDKQTQYPFKKNFVAGVRGLRALLMNDKYWDSVSYHMRTFDSLLPRGYYNHNMVVLPSDCVDIKIGDCDCDQDKNELEVTLLLCGTTGRDSYGYTFLKSFCEVVVTIKKKDFHINCTINDNPRRYCETLNKKMFRCHYFPSDVFMVKVANVIIKNQDIHMKNWNNYRNPKNNYPHSNCLLFVGDSIYIRQPNDTFYSKMTLSEYEKDTFFHNILFFDFNTNQWYFSKEKLAVSESKLTQNEKLILKNYPLLNKQSLDEIHNSKKNQDEMKIESQTAQTDVKSDIYLQFDPCTPHFGHVGVMIRESLQSTFDNAIYLMDSVKRNDDNKTVDGREMFNTSNAFVRINLNSGIRWKHERIIWIGFHKNDENNQCFWNTMPKVIVQLIIKFLRYDKSIFFV